VLYSASCQRLLSRVPISVIRVIRGQVCLGAREAKKLRGFTAAYHCKVLGIADRRGADRTWDRAEAERG
jgi:hypothetical protein